MASKYFEVSEIAERFGVHPTTVLAWIHGGQLRAVNVAKSGNGDGRPKWRVSEQALQQFEERRSVPVTAATA